MKIKRVLLMILVFTVVFGFVATGPVNAQLDDTSWEDTWWQLKVSDKGSVVTLEGAASKFSQKIIEYVYVPVGAWDGTSWAVCGYEPDPFTPGQWVELPYDIIKLSGSGSSVAAYTMVDLGFLSLAATVQGELKEDNKNPGVVKTGKMTTVGSALYFAVPEPAGAYFVGTRQLKGKFIPDAKRDKVVPQEVQALAADGC